MTKIKKRDFLHIIEGLDFVHVKRLVGFVHSWIVKCWLFMVMNITKREINGGGDHHLLFLERFILGTTMINRNTFLGYKNLNGTNIPASLNLTSNESQLFLTCVHSTQWHWDHNLLLKMIMKKLCVPLNFKSVLILSLIWPKYSSPQLDWDKYIKIAVFLIMRREESVGG